MPVETRPAPSCSTQTHAEPATYTAVELAARLGVNPKTLYEGCRSGTVPHLRLGRRYVFPRQAIDKWLDAVGELSPEPVQKPPRRTRSTKRC